jgi:hypothetical protein
MKKQTKRRDLAIGAFQFETKTKQNTKKNGIFIEISH